MADATQHVSAFDLALEAVAASPANNNNDTKAQPVSEGCGDSSSNASNTAMPASANADAGLLGGNAANAAAAAVPPAVDLGAGAAPMGRDALARMWGAQFDSLELDGEWLDRLDMGFDLSDFAGPQGQQGAAAADAAAAAQQRSAGAGPSSEAADGLVPSMGGDHQGGAYDMTAFDADVAAYAALDDFSGAGGLAVPSLGALVHPALPHQPHHHQGYGGFEEAKKPSQQQQQQFQQPPQPQQQQMYAPAPAATPYGALPPPPPQHQQHQQAYYPQQPQQQQQQYAAAPTQYAPPQYHMQQQQPQQAYYQQQQQQLPVAAVAAPAKTAPKQQQPRPNPSAALLAPRAPASTRPTAAPAPTPLTPADANAALTRAERVARFRIKRLRRSFKKTIRYESRRAYAEVRPRIKGRFATKEEVAAYRAAEAALREGRQDVVLPPFFAELAGAIGGAQAQAQAQAAC